MCSSDLGLNFNSNDITNLGTGLTAAGELTITSTSADLNLDSGSGFVVITGNDTLNIGTVTDAAYNSISDSASATYAASDNDLYVEDILETGTSLISNGSIQGDTIDALTSTTLTLGGSVATGVAICNGDSCDTVNIATGADAKTVTIGNETEIGRAHV